MIIDSDYPGGVLDSYDEDRWRRLDNGDDKDDPDHDDDQEDDDE